MPAIPIISGIIKVVDTWIGAKAKRIEVKAEAEAAVMKKAAEHTSDWETAMAEATRTSWKDEAWTIMFIAIIVLCFFPGMAPHIREGFIVLDEYTPPWFQLAVYISICASFGIRGVDKFVKAKRNR